MTAFTAGAASLIGKVPYLAEFLPTPSSAPGLAVFDTWLTQATEWAAGRAGSAWPEHFANGAIHAFLFRPSPAEPGLLLCGAVAPSRDSAGRQFPLAVVAPIHVAAELAEKPHLLPFVLEGFWASATTALWELLAAPTADKATDCANLRVEPVLHVPEAEALYAQWALELALPELWSLLGPPLEGPEPSAVLRVVAETVKPFRDVERPDTLLSLRLPLGLAGGAALCFWVDLLRRCLAWRTTVPSLFWSHDGHWGATLLHLGKPPKEALSELWMPTGLRDEICDLTAAPSRDLLDALPPASAALASVLGAPHAKVSDLLELLRTPVT